MIPIALCCLLRLCTAIHYGSSEYVFMLDTQRLVAIIHVDDLHIGTLDADGEFTTTRIMRLGFYSGPLIIVLGASTWMPSNMYEYRSGMLIPGTMAIRDGGKFIPKAGGRIIPFKDYKYSPSAPRIWNLPGYFKLVKPPMQMK